MKKLLTGLFLIVMLVGLIAAGYVYKATRNLPAIEKMVADGVNPSKYTQIFAKDGTPIMSQGKFHHNDVALKDVSPYFIDALIATEDRRFYNHHGIDPIAIGRAMVQNVTHRAVREGGSTLTQQLARNVFLSNERSVDRKLKEAVLAWELENKLSKDKILELYINNIYFGEGAYGIAAASEIYFGKKPSKLTVDEAALLAGMPQAPSYYSPFQSKDHAKARRNEVLGNLVEVKKLESGELKVLENKGITVNPDGQSLASADKAPYFNRYVIDQVQKYFDLDEQSFWQSGLKIYTTLDLKAQNLGSRALRDQSKAWGRTGPKQQAALLSMDPSSGAILAYVGGKEYSKSQFDRVSKAIRSPGSLFKIFTYTTAIDQGYDPQRVYNDEPIEFNGWHPQNYDKQHHGYMTLARALATSNNIVAVKVLHELSPERVIDMAERMGIRSPLQPYLSLTLGGSDVTLLEITSAFGVLANQGVRAEPYGVEKVTDMDGKLLYEHAPATSDVLNRTTVDTMVHMMMGVVQKGTGHAADIGKPMAGKTGTSDDYRDAWFVGFTPKVITGVWVGNDNNTPMPGMAGGGLPARIWHVYMQAYTADQLAANFDLAYSKPLADADFSTFDLNNLSEQDLDTPLATMENQDPELQNDNGSDNTAPAPNAPTPPPPRNTDYPPANAPIAPLNPVAPQPIPPHTRGSGYGTVRPIQQNSNANTTLPGVVVIDRNGEPRSLDH